MVSQVDKISFAVLQQLSPNLSFIEANPCTVLLLVVKMLTACKAVHLSRSRRQTGRGADTNMQAELSVTQH